MKGVGAILALSVLVGAVATFVTSSRPDTLEHFIESIEADRADPNTADPNTADPNTADPNTADPNTADPNTSDPNPGKADMDEAEAAPWQPILSGVIGTAITFVLLLLASRVLVRSKRMSGEQCTT